MAWKNSLYRDTCLPFGLRSTPKLFNILADLAAWIMQQQGVSCLLHYLADFLTMGPPGSDKCHRNLQTITNVCDMLGIPLALEKVEGPSTSLTFLGITLDTARMEARLPDDKLQRTQQMVEEWLMKKNATKREILSLVGVLQHAAKVVRPGRTFVIRMYATAARIRELDYFTRLNKEFRSDLHWWHAFLTSWNGRSLLQWHSQINSPHTSIATDASGSWGCGAFWDGKWIQWQWPPEWLPASIMAKELAPVILCCAVWGPQLSKKHVLLLCDNSSVVQAINKGSAKQDIVMHLLRSLWFFVAHFNMHMSAVHVPGTNNSTADCLSRDNMLLFFSLNPQAQRFPTPLPQSLLDILSLPGPDWTSLNFLELFTTTLFKV